jgi:large subunit ribosomal protein L18|tara:strand:+ start:324 stop:701 length:378 start_codon:yes stop_codon:yes gene_type:complete
MVYSKTSNRRKIRHLRVRKKISGNSDIPRLSIFRSNKHIYAQVINDDKNETLVSCYSNHPDVISIKEIETNLDSKCLQSYKLGFVLADRCKKIGITKIVFDRGGYRYHGRLKALAEGARKNGMEF